MSGIFMAIGFVLLAAMYLLPTIVAFKRKTAIRGIVTVLNLFLGWTVLGWIASLALAFGPREQPRKDVPASGSGGEGGA